METQTQRNLIDRPGFRYRLKGAIHTGGYRTISEFADHIGFTVGRVSRVVSGWELPSPAMSQKMAEGLGISIKELKNLL